MNPYPQKPFLKWSMQGMQPYNRPFPLLFDETLTQLQKMNLLMKLFELLQENFISMQDYMDAVTAFIEAEYDKNEEIFTDLKENVESYSERINNANANAESALNQSTDALAIAESLDSSIQNAVDMLTQMVMQNGEANPELLQARYNLKNNTSYDYLQARLDNEFMMQRTYADNLFKNVMDSQKPIEVFDTLYDLQQAYPNGTNGVILLREDGFWYTWDSEKNEWAKGALYQATEIADNSVTPQKTTFLKQTKNLATHYITKAVTGTAASLFTMPDGDISLINGRTMIVPIKPNTTYTVTVYDKNESNHFALATDVKIPGEIDYNENNRYVFKTTVYLSTTYDKKTFTFTNAEDTYLFICTSTIGLEPRVMVEEGDLPTEYTAPFTLAPEFLNDDKFLVPGTTKNLVTGSKLSNVSLQATTTQMFFTPGNDDVFVVPIKPNTTYTISVQNKKESDCLLAGTHSKEPTYYDGNMRSYLNNLIFVAVDGNTTRTTTFTNKDDRYLFVKAYTGTDKDVQLQVEEGTTATPYIEPFLYMTKEIADNSVTPQKTTFLKQTKNLATHYITKAVTGTAASLFTMPDGDISLINGRTMIVPIKPNTTYTVTVYDKNESNHFALATDVKIPGEIDYNENNRYVFKTTVYLSTTYDKKTFTFTNAEDTYLFICTSTIGLEPRVMVEEGDLPTEYTAPFNIETNYLAHVVTPPTLPATRNLCTGYKIRTLFTSVSNRSFFAEGDDDVFVVPIKPNTTYTVTAYNTTDSDIFVVASHSKIPSYYEANGRSYLNTHITLIGGLNKQRTITFTNKDDCYLFVKAYSGQDKDVQLQVEEGVAATPYIEPFHFMVHDVDVYSELKKDMHEHDYKAHYVFNDATHTTIVGGVTVETETNPLRTRHNTTSKKITFAPFNGTNNSVEFTLAKPINLHDKSFGFWFYVPRETLMPDDQQRARWTAFAINCYTASGKVFQLYPSQPKRTWGGWNLLEANSFLRDFSDGTTTFEDLKEVVKIRVFNSPSDGDAQPTTIYLDSLVTWKPLNALVVRFEFDDAMRTVYDNAFPIMRKYGVRGCMHVITDRLTDNINNQFATPEQLHHMHDVGWDICPHSQSHPMISTLTTAEIENELKGAQQTLREHGFRNGTDYYIAPYGDNTMEAVSIAKKYYKVYRNTGYQRAVDALSPNRYGQQCFGAGSLGIDGCIALIDRALARGGGFIPFMWHGEIGAPWGGIEWATSDFERLVKYCVDNGATFVTYSDMYK